MSANVHAQISCFSESLADKLESSHDLSNLIIALLGRLVVMCQKKGVPLEGLSLSPMDTHMAEREYIISTHLKFARLSIQPPSLWKPSSDFEAFTASRSKGLALALSKNKSLSKFFQQLVEKIDAYAQHKGVPFESLRILSPFISKDDILVIGVGKEQI